MERRLGCPHLSSGDLLRRAVAERTDLGVVAKRFMDQGELVPNDLVVGMIEERVLGVDAARGFILDGFPRNVAQAEALGRMLETRGLAVDHVFGLVVPRAELLRRLCGRRTCGTCNAMYHVVFDPPRTEGVCDRCGGELFQRDDDKEETIGARLDVYERETLPLCDYYRQRDLLREINAVGSTEEVLGRILAFMDGAQ